MTSLATFDAALAACPLVAILRGVTPDEAIDVGEALVEAGLRIIEVPLNSPAPFTSIARLADRLGQRAIIGAGTVLTIEDVVRVEEAGGRLVVSPNFDPAVIARTVEAGLISLPGVLTPTEAFAALAAGATALKLFPADAASPKMLAAMRAVLPTATRMLAVGGITPDTMPPWLAAGAAGFGLGSALYRPGMTAAAVRSTARAFVAAIAARQER